MAKSSNNRGHDGRDHDGHGGVDLVSDASECRPAHVRSAWIALYVEQRSFTLHSMLPAVSESSPEAPTFQPVIDSLQWTDEGGQQVELRPVMPGETVELLNLLSPMRRVSKGSGSGRPLPRYVDAGPSEVALVASIGNGDEREIIGVGVLRAAADGSPVGEVDVFVKPAYRNRGVGSTVIGRLITIAEAHGVKRLRFRLQPSATESLRLLTRLSTVPTIWEDGDRVVVEFPVAAF